MKLRDLLSNKTLQLLERLGQISLDRDGIEDQFVEHGRIALPISFTSSNVLVVKPPVERPQKDQPKEPTKKPPLRPPTIPSVEDVSFGVSAENSDDTSSQDAEPAAWSRQERMLVTSQLWDAPLQGYVEFMISSNVNVTQFRYDLQTDEQISAFDKVFPVLVQFVNMRECFCSSYVRLHIPDERNYYQRYEFFEYILRGHRGDVVQKLFISSEQTNATTHLVRSMFGGDPATLPDVATMIAEFVTSLISAKDVETKSAASNEATMNEKAANKSRTNKA